MQGSGAPYTKLEGGGKRRRPRRGHDGCLLKPGAMPQGGVLPGAAGRLRGGDGGFRSGARLEGRAWAADAAHPPSAAEVPTLAVH